MSRRIVLTLVVAVVLAVPFALPGTAAPETPSTTTTTSPASGPANAGSSPSTSPTTASSAGTTSPTTAGSATTAGPTTTATGPATTTTPTTAGPTTTTMTTVPPPPPEDFAIAIDGDGSFAPGEHVVVSITGARQGSYVGVGQCSVDLQACTAGTSATIGAAGTGTVELVIHRRVGGGPGVVDCGLDPCQIYASMYSPSLPQVTDAIPITVDPEAPIPRPSLHITSATPIVGTGPVTVAGSGFDPVDYIQFYECSWDPPSAIVPCARLQSASAYTDTTGAFSVSVAVSRVLLGTDCAVRAGRCQLWAVPSGNIDQVWAARLTFDGSTPARFPRATATPSTGLVHGQSVQVVGDDFSANGSLRIAQCTADQAATGTYCPSTTYPVADATGHFSAAVPVRRTIGGKDCAVVGCSIVVTGPLVDSAVVPISFDDSVPPPPAPVLSVEPSTDLADRQPVEYTITGVDANSFVSVATCGPGGTCTPSTYVPTSTGGTVTGVLTVRRTITPTIDCAVVACYVRAVVSNTESITLTVPITFDPDAPPAPPPGARAVPATGLWDRQRVQVRGERFDAGAYLGLRACAGDPTVLANCTSSVTTVGVDATGRASASYSVRRVLDLASGPQDCLVVSCSLVLMDYFSSTTTVLPIAFDPDGPLVGDDLPPQLECVAWPTAGWPTGPLPPGVDPAAVAALGDQMVGPNGGDSVVVIHGGRLVYEKYADGLGPDSVFGSFSVSKSFASTMVGLLVDDGAIDIEHGSLFPEWSDPADPRSAITTHNILNMESGLKWDENYGDPSSDVLQLVSSPDAAAYVIAKPLEVAPGTRHSYSTGDTMLLSRIIGDAAGVSGPTYDALVHDRLLNPLGITPAYLAFDQAGRWGAGWATNTTTRNFAKLGLLYLRHGVWEDEQFLSESWVDFVRTPGPASPGYGGQFWLNDDGSFEMVGLYGQNVLIVPSLDLVVAVNNGGSTYSMAQLFNNAAPPTCDGASAALTDDDASVAPGGSVTVDVLANDDGGPLGLAPTTLTVAGLPAHGSAVVDAGVIRYTPESGFSGTDPFTYVVCTTDRRTCLEATVTVAIGP